MALFYSKTPQSHFEIKPQLACLSNASDARRFAGITH